ncbi:MAG: 2-oxoacid:acceptor oxidoreductase subunit alpha, partial [Chloroflexi bacterium]|nr:2-oxoacid:acceptor oxidoreductase subunit alpha [Chloroflexota bacterium]
MSERDFAVRFAGEGGQGVVTSAEALAQAAAQVGYHVQTFATFPSQILGGPTWTQTRIAVAPVLSSGDQLDVLVAFNREAYDTHKDEVREGGVIVYDSGEFKLDEDDRSFGIAVEELGKSTGNPRAGNMVILGALAHLVSWPEEYLTEFVKKRFSRGRAGDDLVISQNIQALGLGREQAAKTRFTLPPLAPPQKPTYEQVLVKGNDALALGTLAAGLDVYIGYPISPATTILVFMERNLVGPGKFVYQASSEIEAISAVVGAGYAGKKAMTGTSGPGFSLMHEGLGMAWMMEIPCVVALVQRGGPATGLPTKTEQSDFQTALHPAHGDSALPIVAPGTVEECFYAAIQALNWAERYQGPVILLSEMSLAERTENIPKPNVSKVVAENRTIYTGSNGYSRYESSALSPFPVPGTKGSYVANASEHDSIGDTTHLPIRHVQMTERRFGKLKLLEDGTYESELAEQPIALMPWGGSKGPAREAYNALREEGRRIGWCYTMYLH